MVYLEHLWQPFGCEKVYVAAVCDKTQEERKSGKRKIGFKDGVHPVIGGVCDRNW